MDSKTIHLKTREAYNYITSLGYRPIYIGLYGSQNYGLDVYDKEYSSDLDWKCIVIPTLMDLINNSKPVSTVVQFEGGQIDIKDIRAFMDSVVKCNVNFLEILTTEYFCTPNIEMRRLRTFVAPLMKEMGGLYLKACYGMMKEKEAALRHPYPTTKHRVEKYGYDPKQLHHIYRLKILIERYVKCSDKDFISNVAHFSHFGKEQEQLIAIKKGFLPNAEVDVSVTWLLDEAKKAIESFTRPMTFTAKEEMLTLAKRLILTEIVCEIKENRTR